MFQSSLFTNFLSLSSPMTLVALAMLFVTFAVMKFGEKKKISFPKRMILSLVMGVVLGVLLQAISGFPDADGIKNTVWLQQTITWYGLFGRAFVSFIRMLVIPIILVSMIRVILTLKSDFNLKALVSRTLFWLMATTGIAAIVGIVLSLSVNLGSSMVVVSGDRVSREVNNIVNIFIGLIPSNPIGAMVEYNVVAVVIFASMVGSAARFMRTKEKYKPSMDLFADFIESLYRIIMSMAMTVIKYMPYGVIALMATTLASYGVSALADALTFIIIIYVATAVMIVIYIVLIALHGLNPIVFLKKSASAWLMAFSSRSSVGSLPMTISTLEDKLGVNNGTANFVASLGSTAGMNGCAGYFPAMVAILIGTVAGVPMDLSFFIMVVIVAMLGSLGIAGIPGSATMAASIMLSGIGLSEYFGFLAIVLAIDPIIDMARTMINVAGAMTSAICVDKELGLLNVEAYNSFDVKNTESLDNSDKKD